MKKICHWCLFTVLALLAIGQLPTAIGWNVLILALLAMPIPSFQEMIERLLSHCSLRLFLVILCLVCIMHQPVAEFEAAGEQMGRFLLRIFKIFGLK